MKRVSIALFCWLAVVVQGFGQATPPEYLLPKPLPSTGALPPDKFVKPGGTYGPTSYSDLYPAVYDVLLGGSWRSVGTILERDSINSGWRKEGMAVYVAADKSVYLLNADLTTWRNLTELTLAPKTIYSADGDLTGNRVVNGVGFNLSFNNINALLLQSSTMTLGAPFGFTMVTPGTSSGSAHAGDVLTYLGGQVDFRPVPSAVNVYNSDGALTGNRTMDMKGSYLTFQGPGRLITSGLTSYSLVSLQDSTLSTEGQLTLQGTTKLNLKTPSVVQGNGRSGQVLKLVDGSGGVEFFDLPSTPAGDSLNEYYGTADSSDGGISTHVRVLTPTPTYSTTNEYPDFTRAVVRMNQSGAPTNFYPDTKLALGSGPSFPVVTHQFHQPGIMDIATPLGGGMMEVVFDGINKVWVLQDASPSDSAGSGGGSAGVSSLNTLTGALTLQAGTNIAVTPTSSTALRIDNTAGPTIYVGNGTLTSDRTVSAAGFDFAVTNAKSLDMRGWTSTVAGSQKFRLITPLVSQSLVTTGQVLTLTGLDGQAEWRAAPGGTNIYNSDGSLTSSRNLTVGADKYLTFHGGGGIFQAVNFNYNGLNALTNSLYANEESILGASLRFKLITPRQQAVSAQPGHVLMLLNQTNGLADYYPAPNLYTTNGTLEGDRVVEGNFRTLAFTNLNLFSARARTNTVSGSLEFNLRTPNVVNTVAVSNQVLTLMDPNGRVEFKTLPTTPFDVSLYSTNGTLVGNRIVEGGFRDLSFTNLNVYDVRGRTSVISASSEFNIRTPTVNAGSAAANRVLTLLDATTGRSEFSALPADVSIYSQDGTITAARTVSFPLGRKLTFNGAGPPASDFDLINFNYARYYGVTNDIYSSQLTRISADVALRLNPPGTGSASIGDALAMIAAGGELGYRPITNIYRYNGTLTGNRVVSGGGFDLSFSGVKDSLLSAVNNRIAGNAIYLATTNISAGASSIGQILTLADPATGRVEWSNAPTASGFTIYTGNGSLNGGRTVTLAGNTLLFAGPGSLNANNLNSSSIDGTNFTWWARGNFNLYGGATWLQGGTSLKIATPKVVNGATAKVGDVLTLKSTDGIAEWETPLTTTNTDTSIYLGNGTIAGGPGITRTLTGNGNGLLFTGLTDFTSSSTTATLQGSTRLSLKTPGFATRQGQYLQLVDQSTGSVEFAPLPSAVNIYTSDGTLSGSRLVTMGGANLTFTGPGNFNANSLTAYSFNSSSGATLTTSGSMHLQGTAQLDIATPSVVANTAQVGQVLTLMDRDTGRVEFNTPAERNLYTKDGTIPTGNRQVTIAGGGNLIFNGSGTFTTASTLATVNMQAANAQLNGTSGLYLAGYNGFYVGTPKINLGQATANQVLTLLDPLTGRVDFTTINTGSATVDTIYSANGSLNSDRIVSLANHSLTFQGGASGGDITMAAVRTITQTSTTESIYQSPSLKLGGSSAIWLRTPRVQTGGVNGPQAGEVLVLKNTSGDVDFAPIQTITGIVEYYGDTTGDLLPDPGDGEPSDDPISTLTVSGSNLTPAFSGNVYSDFMRISCRANVTRCNYTGQPVYLKVGNGTATAKQILNPARHAPYNADIQPGLMMELMYDAKAKGGVGAWIMLDFGVGGDGNPCTPGTVSAGPELKRAISTVPQPLFIVTNSVTSRVTTVSYAGVVDTFPDLASVPLTFKKVSTLGLVEVGDGKHGDYFQTTYDPLVPETVAKRSTINPGRMWKLLVAH